MPTRDSRCVLLSGLDGGNPLGFLAAVGALRVLGDTSADSVRLRWRRAQGGWRPRIVGYGGYEQELGRKILEALKGASTTVFDIAKENKNGKEYNKFPFSSTRFACALKSGQETASPSKRRDVDFLASFGTELYPDEKTGEFQETRFRMVRSGDSNRQGMLFYAKAIREALDSCHVERALFQTWDYRDERYSLRWDPIEDQSYALRWKNPSRSGLADGPGTMLAANCLAIEALACFPTVATGRRARTTGFHGGERQELRFVWPIWTPAVDLETLRSLLASRDLYETPLRRQVLLARGIEEVYAARRVQPNRYYGNFAPAQPLM